MEFMDARAKRLENKRRRIDEVHTSETEGAKKLRLERSCERAALEHLAEPDKAKKLRLEKRRDRYAAAPSPYMGNRCVRGLTFPIYGHKMSLIHISVSEV